MVERVYDAVQEQSDPGRKYAPQRNNTEVRLCEATRLVKEPCRFSPYWSFSLIPNCICESRRSRRLQGDISSFSTFHEVHRRRVMSLSVDLVYQEREYDDPDPNDWCPICRT